MYGKIEICKISKLKNSQDVKLQIVKDNEKQISGIALCTTSDGKGTEVPIKSYEQITRGDRVSIAITKSENQELTDCVANIIRCDGYTETHSIWSEKEASLVVADILGGETASQSIELLSKNILAENCDPTRLYITSTAIKQTIEWLISTLLTEKTTLVYTELSPALSSKGMTFQICSLTEKHTERISDSSRYKMCGNAVTTNVVQAVFERIFELAMEVEV